MTNLMRWISRSVFHAQAAAESLPPLFEHIDATGLGATDFRASAAMRLDPMELEDFCETLPAYVRGNARNGEGW